MSLRLRLALLSALLVAIVLSASGLGMRWLLRRELRNSLDRSLTESAQLATTLVQDEDGRPSLRTDDSVTPRIGEISLVLLDRSGRIVDSLGRVPAGLTTPPAGFSSRAGWRQWRQDVPGGAIVSLGLTDRVDDALDSFDRALWVLAPLAALSAVGLGLPLAGQALAPVDRLTRAALDLAARRAWRERLPEPRTRDELHRLSRATNALLAALAEVIEAERRFTADAAHELRTPLTVLRGRLEQAIERSAEPAARQALEKAVGAADDLLGLVERLLVLARTEAGVDLAAEPLALDEVALEAAEGLGPLFRARGLRLVLDLPDAPVLVHGDRVALGLAARNLLENALKFTPAGQVRLTVETVGARARLAVEDTGPGVPETALPHLFERFYQADARHRRSGSGLGLALVKGVARWHGGLVSAANGREGGAIFWLELPLVQGRVP